MRESVSEVVQTAPVAGAIVMVGIAGNGGSIRGRFAPAAHRKWSEILCDLGRVVAEEGGWLVQEAVCQSPYWLWRPNDYVDFQSLRSPRQWSVCGCGGNLTCD